ncbi:MAG: acyl-CoA dehydrogenase family protein [Longimicrobiales bacterium]
MSTRRIWARKASILPGFTPIEKYMRDAKITQIYEGTNQIQRDEIGKILIGEHVSGKAR